MSVSIKKHFSHAPSQEAIEFKRVMDAVLADLTSQKVVIDAMVALTTELRVDHALFITLTDELKIDIATIATFEAALTAKLDADAGITDVDYASTLTEVVALAAANVSTITAAAATSSALTLES